MAVKGEGAGNLQPFHHGKAHGVSEGEVFVGVLEDDAPSTFLIAGSDTHDNSGRSFHVPEELGGSGNAEGREDQGMGLNVEVDGTRLLAEREGIISFPLSAVELASTRSHLEAAVAKSGFPDLDAWLGEVQRLNHRRGGDAWYTLFRIRRLAPVHTEVPIDGRDEPTQLTAR